MLIMFIGDQGTGVGSSIKGFKRYGGPWKEKIHGKATIVCKTDENYTSQTCVFCYAKLIHPVHQLVKNGQKIKKTSKGSFQCVNSHCVSVLNKRAVKSRDTFSALAIGMLG